MITSGEPLGGVPLVAQGRRKRQPSENDIIFSTCDVIPREEVSESPLPLKDVRVRVLPPYGVAHDGLTFPAILRWCLRRLQIIGSAIGGLSPTSE
jgi:hypothetical protein